MKNSQENTTFILADVKVFDFLKEKAGERKTKTEAYWDLLDRSMAGFVSPFVRKVERKLLSNQCHVTISDLAESWHWHRATVRTFLDALESFGLLERTKLKKSVIITMTVQSGKLLVGLFPVIQGIVIAFILDFFDKFLELIKMLMLVLTRK